MEVKDDNSAETPGNSSVETKAQKNPNTAEAPSKPQSGKKKQDEPTGLVMDLIELQKFLKETVVEFRKISWPTRTQVIKETWSVLVLVTALTLAVLAFDFGIARVVFEPLDKWAKKIGGGVGGGQAQTWGPLQAEPGAPVDQPGVPGNALPEHTLKILPVNPANKSEPASPAPSSAPVPTDAPTPPGAPPTPPPAQPESGK